MPDITELPELCEGDQGHIEAHTIIRALLRDHDARLRGLEARIGRLEPQPWLPEDPDHEGQRPLLPDDQRQAPELPEQPPKQQNPQLPEQPPNTRQQRPGR